jgi:PAS domain S-box-containing protein
MHGRRPDNGVGVEALEVAGKRHSYAERGVFEQFLEFAPDAIVGIDQSGEIALVNQQAERLFGYSREQLLGQAVEKLLPERFRKQHLSHRESYFEDPRTRSMGAGHELYGRRSDGTEFPAEISLSSIDPGGQPMGIAAVRDMTDRVDAEREKQALISEMQREKQSEQASRLESVGQLAGGVAHDFNNLLGVILNYADFIAEEIGEESPAHEDVKEIRRAAERATQLTRQLLIFSRRDVVKPQPINLNDSVREMERLLRRTIGEHIELAVKFGSDLPAVMADPGQLEQVLVNLALNARDAMPQGGRLRIETATIEADDDFLDDNPDLRPGRYVKLTVADTGTGMEEETLRRVFEPFFSTKPKGEGTGLGLATVYGIVRGARGAISIHSELGEGTAFTVHLPAVDAAVSDHSEADGGDGPSGSGERILVVEDEDAVRTLANRILSRAGYEVIAVSRAREAVDLLENGGAGYALLLTDVVMPEMRGVELVQVAKAVAPELPILMMSGYSTPMAEDERKKIDSIPLLEKPFSGSALLTEVRDLLDPRAAE